MSSPLRASRAFVVVARRPVDSRPLGTKLQELAFRSPEKVRALERVVDLLLRRLNERQTHWRDAG